MIRLSFMIRNTIKEMWCFWDSELKTITGVKRDHWVAAAVNSFAGYAAWLRRSKGLFYYGVLCGGIVIFIADAAVCKGVDIR